MSLLLGLLALVDYSVHAGYNLQAGEPRRSAHRSLQARRSRSVDRLAFKPKQEPRAVRLRARTCPPRPQGRRAPC